MCQPYLRVHTASKHGSRHTHHPSHYPFLSPTHSILATLLLFTRCRTISRSRTAHSGRSGAGRAARTAGLRHGRRWTCGTAGGGGVCGVCGCLCFGLGFCDGTRDERVLEDLMYRPVCDIHTHTQTPPHTHTVSARASYCTLTHTHRVCNMCSAGWLDAMQTSGRGYLVRAWCLVRAVSVTHL